MNLPSLLVLFIGGWGVAPNDANNLFYSSQFSFLDEYISAYPSLTISKPKQTLAKTYQMIGGGGAEQKALLPLLTEHQIRLVAIGGAERYGLLTSDLASTDAIFEESNSYYCSTPPTPSLSDHPESSLSQITKQIEAQMKYAKDAVIFASIESIATALRYHSKDVVNKSIIATDKYLKKTIQEALVAGIRILIIGDSIGAESFGDDNEQKEELLPVVFIAKDQEGLRASDKDYANDSVFPLKPSGTIHDLAPTILSLMHIPKPEYFSGTNLFSESLN